MWFVLGAIVGVTILAPMITGDLSIEQVMAYGESAFEKGWKIFEVIIE